MLFGLARRMEGDDLKVPKASRQLRHRADFDLAVVGNVGEDLLDARLGQAGRGLAIGHLQLSDLGDAQYQCSTTSSYVHRGPQPVCRLDNTVCHTVMCGT